MTALTRLASVALSRGQRFGFDNILFPPPARFVATHFSPALRRAARVHSITVWSFIGQKSLYPSTEKLGLSRQDHRPSPLGLPRRSAALRVHAEGPAGVVVRAETQGSRHEWCRCSWSERGRRGEGRGTTRKGG